MNLPWNISELIVLRKQSTDSYKNYFLWRVRPLASYLQTFQSFFATEKVIEILSHFFRMYISLALYDKTMNESDILLCNCYSFISGKKKSYTDFLYYVERFLCFSPQKMVIDPWTTQNHLYRKLKSVLWIYLLWNHCIVV